MSAKKEDDSEKSEADWKDTLALFFLNASDAGYLPWLLVSLFCLACIWLLTRNLDSKDSLGLLGRIGTLHGFAWIGWIVALIEIPIARWAFDRSKRLQRDELERLTEENAKARKLLKKSQKELDLPLEKRE